MKLCCLKCNLLFCHLSSSFWGESIPDGAIWGQPYIKAMEESLKLERFSSLNTQGRWGPLELPARAPFPPLLALLHPENPVDVKVFRLSKGHQDCPGRDWFLYFKHITKTHCAVELDQKKKQQNGKTAENLWEQRHCLILWCAMQMQTAPFFPSICISVNDCKAG